MKTFIVQRNMASVGKSSTDELIGLSKKMCKVMEEIDSKQIRWITSYITEEKIFCVYEAISKMKIMEHANIGGFPVNSIMEVNDIINPDTANSAF